MTVASFALYGSLLLFFSLTISAQADFMAFNTFDPNPIYISPMYDIVQYDESNLTSDQSIQFDFMNESFVELADSKKPECSDPSFSTHVKDHDVSEIRVLFNTSAFIQAALFEIYIGFAVNCPHGHSNTNWWKIAAHDMFNLSLPYTRGTMNVGRCRKTKDRNITGVEILFSLDDGFTKTSTHLKALRPAPIKKCETMNSFKTIYIPKLPTL